MEEVFATPDTLRAIWAHLGPPAAAALVGTSLAARDALVAELHSTRFVCCRGTPLGVRPARLAEADRRGERLLGEAPRAARAVWVCACRTMNRALSAATLRSLSFLLRHTGPRLQRVTFDFYCDPFADTPCGTDRWAWAALARALVAARTRLDALVVVAPRSDAALEELAGAGLHARALELRRVPLPSPRALSGLSALVGLREVCLVCTRLTAPALCALLGAAARGLWTHLALRMAGLTPEHLAASRPLWALGWLEGLEVHSCPLGHRGCSELLRLVAPLGALCDVRVTHCADDGDDAADDDAAEAALRLLAANPGLAHPDLSGSIAGDPWARGVAAAGAGGLGRLRELALGATGLSSAMFGALLRVAPPSLRALRVAHNAISDPPSMAPAPALTELDLTGNGIGEAALGALHLPALAGSLRVLRLGMNGLGAAPTGLPRVARGCPGLVLLDLECNELDDAAVLALQAALPAGRRVRVLLAGNELTNACSASLRTPHCFELWPAPRA